MELVVALDHSQKSYNLALAQSLAGLPLWLKVGFRSFIRDGASLIQELYAIDPSFKIFLDLKLYDIPNTMADAAEEIARLGVEMFNVHASAGTEAMEMIMQRLECFERRPLVLAVTALTSFDEAQFAYIYGDSIATRAAQMAKEAYRCGLDGVVCSAWESQAIKKQTDQTFSTLTPGIRPFKENANDQKRIATIEQACNEAVDYVVVGRPIYRSSEPRKTAKKILKLIDQSC